MRRRRYLTRIGAGLGVGITGLAGCGAPGEPTETETEAVGGDTETATETETTAGAETETTTGGEETETTTTEEETTAGNETADTETGTGTGGQETPSEVAMVTDEGEYYFDPIGLFVEPGTSITWVNDSGSHSSTAYTEENPQSEVRRIPEDAEGWDSGILSEQGADFSYTFEVEGTYDYYCTPHKTLSMVARIVVGEPSGLEDNPPDGAVPAEQEIVDQGAISVDEFEGN